MILIRTCGDARVGMGHLSRMLTLAATMRDDFNREVVFLVNRNVASEELIRSRGFNALTYQEYSPECLGGVLDAIPVEQIVTCVIDAPEIEKNEVSLYKGLGIRVAVVVCKGPARLLADINVFPVAHYDFLALGWSGYQGALLGGADFVVLPKEFTSRQASGLIPYEKRRKILVTMGGADPNSLTIMIMQALRGVARDNPVEIVLGHNCRCKDEVRKINDEYDNVFAIRENIENMAPIMEDAALAITALGITIYELASMGVPTVVINNFSHDEDDADGLEKLGFMRLLGNYKNLTVEFLRNNLESLWNDLASREVMANKAAMVTDGVGTRRICAALLNQTGVA
ncbi:hypothetical protein KI809_06370 [Geobacter pelophilus]|uniref:Glycosyl transferase family 28 C-terminal domain-containing protein n=1 Tax=Geoanaerobacter pelophilus TaxID=60036 RepID=A0AAW4L7C6_9BACT|nr:glycosyltransferase [Geoanaerobacter pelophilus]MBT0663924.1 hypothetical protein [Geoanaerobacter pelophilus]